MTSSSTPAPAPPASVPFPLQEHERVLLLVRRHWFYLWPRTLLLAAYGLVPVILFAWIRSLFGGTPGTIMTWVAVGWLLFWSVRVFMNWYAYHNDIWVVTDQRLVDVTRPTPWHKRLATADLRNIQDMKVVQRGFFATGLKFGDVLCQTAGRDIEFCLAGVRAPEDVQLFIDRERDRARAHRGGA